MTPEDPRDRLVDQLLRQSLRPRAPVVSHECLDPETLAAWMDRGLDSASMQRAEAHVAECARCQALVGAMAHTAPAAPTEPRWWQTWNIRWLVPLTAGLAATALWMVLPREQSSPLATPAPMEARAQAPAEASQSFADRAGPAPAPFVPPAAPPQERAAGSRERPSEARQTPAKAKTDGPARADNAVAATATAPAEAKLADARSERLAAAPVATGASASAPASASAIAPANAALETLGRLRMADGQEIASPDRQVRWRLHADGRAEGTRDGGATWRAAATSIVGGLTAGSAPARDVCWLVGRGGVVVATSDGQAWRRVPFPEAVDLAAIVATSDRAAVVTASDGRVFRTADGGATWQPQPR